MDQAVISEIWLVLVRSMTSPLIEMIATIQVAKETAMMSFLRTENFSTILLVCSTSSVISSVNLLFLISSMGLLLLISNLLVRQETGIGVRTTRPTITEIITAAISVLSNTSFSMFSLFARQMMPVQIMVKQLSCNS